MPEMMDWSRNAIGPPILRAAWQIDEHIIANALTECLMMVPGSVP